MTSINKSFPIFPREIFCYILKGDHRRCKINSPLSLPPPPSPPKKKKTRAVSSTILSIFQSGHAYVSKTEMWIIRKSGVMAEPLIG